MSSKPLANDDYQEPQADALLRLSLTGLLPARQQLVVNPRARTAILLEQMASDGDGLGVSAVGCSGPARGNYTFDAHPERVVIHVLPGDTPTGKVVSFAAYWDSSSQVVTGTCTFDPNLCRGGPG